MDRADIPTRFPVPFADQAVAPYVHEVPEDSQVSVTAGAASLETGFPPLNFSPISAGGVPFWGNDVNGILKQITQWSQWQAAGAPVVFDSSFATSIAGYPKGAVVASDLYEGYSWLSTVDANTTDPETGTPDVPATGWLPIALKGGTAATGDWKWRPTDEDLDGWVKANGGTIGNGSSGATLLASAQAKALFGWFWRKFSDSVCPVSGGRGASAAADFAANKTIAVLSLRGTGIVGMDTMGGGATTNLTGVPVTNGSATAAGSLLGENLHTLTTAQVPASPVTASGSVTPTQSGGSTAYASDGQSIGTQGGSSFGVTAISHMFPMDTKTVNSTGTVTGGGGSHNTVGLSVTGTMYWKL